MFTLRDAHSEVSVAVATPLLFVVLVIVRVVVMGWKLPPSAVNVTVVPGTRFAQESLTVAVMVALSIPSPRIVSGARVTVNSAGEPAETVRFTLVTV